MAKPGLALQSFTIPLLTVMRWRVEGEAEQFTELCITTSFLSSEKKQLEAQLVAGLLYVSHLIWHLHFCEISYILCVHVFVNFMFL